MKRRMIDAGLWANEKFAELPSMARLLQIGLITLADDQGRVKAHPSYLRSQLFPYDEDVTVAGVRKWLESICANGTAITYESGGKEYLQLVNWWEYQSLQYAAPSEYPRPEGWQDRIRYNAKGGATLTCNWITPKGETPVDTCDQDGNPLPIVADIPPKNPGGRPPKNPGGNTNKDPIEIKDPIEDQVEEDDTHARDAIHAAWYEDYGSEMPETVEAAADKLKTECGEEAVIHGIHESKKANAKTFAFIAKCARNYIPPAPATNGSGYRVDVPDVEFMPGVHPLQPRPEAGPLVARNGHSPPLPTGDPWAIALPELLQTLTGSAPRWLADSRLESNGELAGVPLYRLIVTQPGANAQWLTQQAEPAIRKKLAGLLGKRIQLDIVVAEQEPAP